MSQSTDAIMFYGVAWEEEGEPSGFCKDASDLGPLYTAGQKAGVRVDTHCSCDYPLAFLAIEETIVKAKRGFPKPCHQEQSKAEWHDRLCAFAKEHNLKLAHEPRWTLVSDWC